MKTSNKPNHNQDQGRYKQTNGGRLFLLSIGKTKTLKIKMKKV